MSKHESINIGETPVERMSTALIAAVTVTICFVVGVLGLLVWHGASITELVAYFGATLNAIIGFVVLRRQEAAESKLDKVERNTNGNMTALIEKLNHTPSVETVTESEPPVEPPYGRRDAIRKDI